MKTAIFAILLIMMAMIPGVLADGNVTNSTNQTAVPIIMSFQGGHAFGENPVQIIDNQTGEIVFIGNTSSRNIRLPPDHGYFVRVEPAGLSDAVNSPDSAMAGALNYVRKNPIGLVFFAFIIVISISVFIIRRKK